MIRYKERTGSFSFLKTLNLCDEERIIGYIE